MVISTLQLYPSRDQRRHMLTILRSVQTPTLAQAHCKSCGIYEEDGCDGSVLYLERWDSKAEFERHVRSELYRRILAAVDFSRKPPQIAFEYVSASRGMDLIEALRQEPQASDKPI